METGLRRILRTLPQGEHICLLYEGERDQLDMVTAYVRAGLERGERCVYVADDRSVAKLREALREEEIDVEREEARGAFRMLTKREAYLQTGQFDPTSMLALLAHLTEEALKDGFSGLRVTGEMTWALGPETGNDRLVEYEALLNDFFPGSHATGLCQYNVERFDPSILVQILRTHPSVAFQGRICPSLYFEPAASVLGKSSEAERFRWMLDHIGYSAALEARLERRTLELAERVKEQRCLYSVARLLHNTNADVDGTLRQLVNLLPAAWQYPARASGRITLDGRTAVTTEFRESLIFIAAPILVDDRLRGKVELFYGPAGDGEESNTFLPEEEQLISGVAEHIAAWLQRREAERAQKKSEALFRSLTENGGDLVAVVDGEGRLVYVSGSFTRVLGWPQQELACRPLLELVHPEDGSRAQSLLRPVAGARPEAALEVRVRASDGSWHVLESVATDLTADPAVRGVVINSRDVTERRAAEQRARSLEEQLLRTQKMEALGRLAGGVAHDFNNLLTVILGNLTVVLDQLTPDCAYRAELEDVIGAAQRAGALTRQLLAFGRRQVMTPRAIDPSGVVTELERMLRRLIGEDIELVTSLATNGTQVLADPANLEQIVLNLVVNSRDSMPRGGRVSIATKNVVLDAEYAAAHVEVRPGPYVMLSVTDSGSGIPKEIQGRIFEPFFTTKAGGTGLGLAMVYGVVKQLGGHVSLYSEEGRGTTFKVFLPAIDGPSSSAAVTASAPAPQLGTETILVVEDEPAVRALAKRALERRGYRVLEASDGEEATRILGSKEQNVRLLVTDVVMPKMGGPELAERLAKLVPGLKVLFTSGYADNALSLHGLLDPGAAFVEKPFTPDQLAGKVREVLDAPRGGRPVQS